MRAKVISMRALFALVSILVFILPQTTLAVFYNNTEVIEIGDGSPDEPSAPPSGGSDTGGTGGDSGGTTQTDQGTAGSSGTTGSGSSSGSSAGGGAGSESGGSGGSGVITQEDLVQALVIGGAITGISGDSSSQQGSEGAGASGSAGGTDGSSNSAASGSVPGSSGSASMIVHVIASKVRDALKDNADLQTMLQYWKRGTRTGPFSSDEYGLIAASTALRDSNVQEVTFTASKFEIVYRSRGYLLVVIPWSFPVRVSIVPDAVSLAERVDIKLPWYRFFVRKFFTNDSLTTDIDAVITETKKGNTDASADGTAIVFDAVSRFLKKKVGTIQDSIILGTPAS